MNIHKYRIGVVVFLTTLTLTSLLPLNIAFSQHSKKPSRSLRKLVWQDRLKKEIAGLEKTYPKNIGLFIKDLNSGDEFSLHGEESWYLASTIKIPVAMEILRQVDAKKLSLNDRIEITSDDYVDGNGPLKNMKPGSKVSIRFLIEQMIVWSDNVASDMLIRVAGLDNVNELIKKLSPDSFSPITTLKDVRRHLYSELHPGAFELTGQNFMQLKKIDSPSDRISKLASLLNVGVDVMGRKNIHEAYQAYYKKGLNSASPRSFSRILEALWDGKVLTQSSRDFLVQTMVQTQTGKKRIRAGLKSPLIFAHKTGTQYQRIVDVGYVWNPDNIHRKPIIVVSFVRDIPARTTSARILEDVAKIISNSGIL